MDRHAAQVMAVCWVFTTLLLGHANAEGMTPDKVVLEFLRARGAGDDKASIGHLITEERKLSADKDGNIVNLPWDGPLTMEYKVGEAKTKGTRAVVRVDFKSEEGGKEVWDDAVIVCHKEAGEWKVALLATHNAQMAHEEGKYARSALTWVSKGLAVYYLKKGRKLPAKLFGDESGIDPLKCQVPLCYVVDEIRIASDGRRCILRAESKDSDRVHVCVYSAGPNSQAWLPADAMESDEVIRKDGEQLLKTVRDKLRAAAANGQGVPATAADAATGLVAFDLVGQYWISRNEVGNANGKLTLKADSMLQGEVLVLTCDIKEGDGKFTTEQAYPKADADKWSKARDDLTALNKAVQAFTDKAGALPKTLADVKGAFKGGALPKDPFTQKEYSYKTTATGGYVLGSHGRDGKPGGRWLPDKDIEFDEVGRR